MISNITRSRCFGLPSLQPRSAWGALNTMLGSRRWSSSQCSHDSADVVICGAGLAGIATAYYLAVQKGIRRVVLVDPRSPLEYTSSRSTECFRNLWQDPCMARLMTRSIDLIERLHSSADPHPFTLRRDGYVWFTNDAATASEFLSTGQRSQEAGAGSVRVHDSVGSYRRLDDAQAWRAGGVDILHGSAAIRSVFPFISHDVLAALHARKAGSLDAHQMGMYMLEQAKLHGTRVVRGRLTDIHVQQNSVSGCLVAVPAAAAAGLPTPPDKLQYISCGVMVNGAGPACLAVHRMLNHAITHQQRTLNQLHPFVQQPQVPHSFQLPDLPVTNEIHAKVTAADCPGDAVHI